MVRSTVEVNDLEALSVTVKVMVKVPTREGSIEEGIDPAFKTIEPASLSVVKVIYLASCELLSLMAMEEIESFSLSAILGSLTSEKSTPAFKEMGEGVVEKYGGWLIGGMYTIVNSAT